MLSLVVLKYVLPAILLVGVLVWLGRLPLPAVCEMCGKVFYVAMAGVIIHRSKRRKNENERDRFICKYCSDDGVPKIYGVGIFDWRPDWRSLKSVDGFDDDDIDDFDDDDVDDSEGIDDKANSP